MKPILAAAVCVLPCVLAHGHLTRPSRRKLKDDIRLPSGRDFIEDEDMPVNNGCDGADWGCSRNSAGVRAYPVMDPANHPDGSSWVCKIDNQNYKSGRVSTIQAGSTMEVKYVMTAPHQGNADLFISYDWDMVDTLQMRWFKIAQFPQARCNNAEVLNVNLPAWLPAGRAVVRWAWYTLHDMDNAIEFFNNCADVQIESSSTLSPSAIPSYVIEVDGPGGGTSTGPGSYPYKDWDDTYWALWDERRAPFRTWRRGYVGPPCVGGVEGNCCDLDYYEPYIVWANGGCDASVGIFGYQRCANSGNSGPAAFLAQQPLPPPAPPLPPPPPSPPPPRPVADQIVPGYRLVHANKDCCRRVNKVQTYRNVGAADECANFCSRDDDCQYFSHSVRWLASNGGICTLCSACSRPTGAPGSGQYYASWASLNAPAPPTASPSRAPPPPPALMAVPPPSTIEKYSKIANNKDCCRYNEAKIRGYGRRQTAQQCFELCDSHSDCRYFSHSQRYLSGLCVLCSWCELSGAPGNGRHYTSWEKAGARGSAAMQRIGGSPVSLAVLPDGTNHSDAFEEFEEYEEPVGPTATDTTYTLGAGRNDNDDDDDEINQVALVGGYFGISAAMLLLGALCGGLLALRLSVAAAYPRQAPKLNIVVGPDGPPTAPAPRTTCTDYALP